MKKPTIFEKPFDERTFISNTSIKIYIDYAPSENGEEFNEWCERYGFTPLNGPRRAVLVSPLIGYFRGAAGIANTRSGEFFLVYPHDLTE